jgi:hypothetical protein
MLQLQQLQLPMRVETPLWNAIRHAIRHAMRTFSLVQIRMATVSTKKVSAFEATPIPTTIEPLLKMLC